MNTARKGRRKEHKVRDLFVESGYIVVRAAGSLGPIDLVCLPTVCPDHGVAGCLECGITTPVGGDDSGDGFDPSQVVLVQVKPRPIYRSERMELEKLARSMTRACRVEGWVVRDYRKPFRQFFF